MVKFVRRLNLLPRAWRHRAKLSGGEGGKEKEKGKISLKSEKFRRLGGGEAFPELIQD